MPAPTPRTTDELVKGIIEVEEGKDLTPFIRAANMLVTAVCTWDGSDGKVPYTDGYEDSQMEIIERWLAAHFYTVFDNQLTDAKAGTVRVSYQNKIEYGLRSSIYGQNALRLDYYGGLVALELDPIAKRDIKLSATFLGHDLESLRMGI